MRTPPPSSKHGGYATNGPPPRIDAPVHTSTKLGQSQSDIDQFEIMNEFALSYLFGITRSDKIFNAF